MSPFSSLHLLCVASGILSCRDGLLLEFQSLLQATHPKSKVKTLASLESENCHLFLVMILFDGQKVFTFFHLHCISVKESLKVYTFDILFIHPASIYNHPSRNFWTITLHIHSLPCVQNLGCGGSQQNDIRSWRHTFW